MTEAAEHAAAVIDTFGRAAEFNELTSGREGNLVLLGPELADEVMITGDLHGHTRNFNFIRKIAALAQHPRRHLVLQEVCHGGQTYEANGGCMSHKMLEDVARLKTEYPDQVHFLLGNHELAELTDYPIQKNRKMLNLLFRMGIQHAYGSAAEEVRQAYCAFLRSCPLAVRMPGGVFVSHSIPEVCDTLKFDTTIFTRRLSLLDYRQRNAVFELVWGRDYRQQNADAFARLVGAEALINGHEPCPGGFAVPNRRQIILDCCGDRACYLILRPDQPLGHDEIVKRIQLLA